MLFAEDIFSSFTLQKHFPKSYSFYFFDRRKKNAKYFAVFAPVQNILRFFVVPQPPFTRLRTCHG